MVIKIIYNKYRIIFRSLLLIFLGAIIGISIIKYDELFRNISDSYFNTFLDKEKQQEIYGPWSIGIYLGDSPFDLYDPYTINNPVLSGKDVTDVNAKYVADPFLIKKNGVYNMFFEVFNRQTGHGDIGFAQSSDGVTWEYKNIIIDENFHLSYPYVFSFDNNIYLIPESHQDLSIRVYKSVSFPTKWEYLGNILSGYHYVDPSIFRYNKKWWLFVSNTQNDILNLYYSETLLGNWKPHPMNPIIKFDKNIARPGGRVINYNGRIYRLTQDDYPTYGNQVYSFEIVELSENTYNEKMVSENPIVKKTGDGWNAVGMHHVDLHNLGKSWIAAVDGKMQMVK